MKTFLKVLWSNPIVCVLVASLIMICAGLLSARLTPRGPVTSWQAIITVLSAILAGILVGLITGRRRSAWLAPVIFIAVFEAARLPITGPTVDAVHLRSTYGIIAFVIGRLFHSVLAVVPLMLGTRYGVWLAYQLGKENGAKPGTAGWIVTFILTLAVAVFVFFIARPAEVRPVTGENGEVVPGSISEIIAIPLGGKQQAVMIRSRNTDNPVVLYLAGGPGGTDLGAMRADVSLEQDFIVVTWEQRGVGKSYASLDPVDTLTLESMIADTVELASYLKGRFGEEKIYLAGNSWGTLLGTLVVKQHPELFYAYVGTGQMVNIKQTDIMFYEDTLAWAQQTGNAKLSALLLRNGLPPYDNLLDYEPAISYEHAWNPYPYLDTGKEMPSNLFVPENSFIDRVNGLRSFLDTFSVLYPQIQEVDLRRDAAELDVPVYMLIGKYEARGRAELAYEWFEMLEAPAKELIIFDRSGHRPLFEEPGRFAGLMKRVLDETY